MIGWKNALWRQDVHKIDGTLDSQRSKVKPLKVKLPYLLSCVGRLGNVESEFRGLCESVIGRILGSVLVSMRPIALSLYKSALGKLNSPFGQSEAAAGIRLAATHGQPGAIRYVCSGGGFEFHRDTFLFQNSMISQICQKNKTWNFFQRVNFSKFFKTSRMFFKTLVKFAIDMREADIFEASVLLSRVSENFRWLLKLLSIEKN